MKRGGHSDVQNGFRSNPQHWLLGYRAGNLRGLIISFFGSLAGSLPFNWFPSNGGERGYTLAHDESSFGKKPVYTILNSYGLPLNEQFGWLQVTILPALREQGFLAHTFLGNGADLLRALWRVAGKRDQGKHDVRGREFHLLAQVCAAHEAQTSGD